MELYAADVEGAMAQGHDLPFLALCGHFEAVGEGFARDNPGVVAAYGEGCRETVEEVVVGGETDGRLHAVKHVGEVLQARTEGFADGLMTKAHAEDGLLAGVCADDVKEEACLRGNAGTGREDNLVVRLEVRELELVVANGGAVGTELLHEMREVESEAVVVIDDDDFHEKKEFKGFKGSRSSRVKELKLFGFGDGTAESAELVVDFLELVFDITLSDDAAAGLEPEFATAADEGADGNSLIEGAVETDESDAAAVGAAVVRLNLGDELHSTYLGRAGQCAGREGVDERLDGRGAFVERSADAGDKMDDVRIELHILEELHVNVMTVAAEVVACEIHEHDVLCILLGVGAQVLGSTSVFVAVAGTARSSGYGVDISRSSLYSAVCLRRGSEDAEAAEVEVEEVGRGIDAAQRPVELEVVAREALAEAAREHDLEDIAAQTVLDATTDVVAVLVVGQRRGHITFGMERVGRCNGVAADVAEAVEVVALTIGEEFDEGHRVVEVVEDDDIFIEDIEQVGCIVLRLCLILDGDLLEITDGVECGIAIETAERGSVAGDGETGEERLDGGGGICAGCAG